MYTELCNEGLGKWILPAVSCPRQVHQEHLEDQHKAWLHCGDIHLLSNTNSGFFMGKRDTNGTDQTAPSSIPGCVFTFGFHYAVWTDGSTSQYWLFFLFICSLPLYWTVWTSILFWRICLFSKLNYVTKITCYSPFERLGFGPGFLQKQLTIRKEKCCKVNNYLARLMKTVVRSLTISGIVSDTYLLNTLKFSEILIFFFPDSKTLGHLPASTVIKFQVNVFYLHKLYQWYNR